VICSAGVASAEHYWVNGVVWFCPTPDIFPGACPSLPRLTQFDVLAKSDRVAPLSLGNGVAQIRLGNGAVGYTNIPYDLAVGGSTWWSTVDPDAEFQKFLDKRHAAEVEMAERTKKCKRSADPTLRG
jgi:hypothetical protein